jgi:hypothetical protein
MVNVCPATLRVPERWLEELAATVNQAMPDPTPLRVVTVIQLTWLVAVHGQFGAVVTEIPPMPPTAEYHAVSGEIL